MRFKYILFLLIVIGCVDIPQPPYFNYPLPRDKQQASIPDKFIGTYKNLLDSTFLTVSKSFVILTNFSNLNVPLTEVDSIDKLTLKDTIYSDKSSTLRVTITDDSVFQRTISIDTLYFASSDFLIRKQKGFYFLNKRMFKNENVWIVQTLRVTDNGILIGMIESEEDIDSLDSWDEPDSISRTSPTVNSLLDFIKDKRFENESKFVRVEHGEQAKLAYAEITDFDDDKIAEYLQSKDLV